MERKFTVKENSFIETEITAVTNEGSGVSRLVREKCDMIASIPQKGEINSLNASVAAGVLCYEIFRQRNL